MRAKTTDVAVPQAGNPTRARAITVPPLQSRQEPRQEPNRHVCHGAAADCCARMTYVMP